MAKVGFDSEFVNPPSDAFQVECPVCHLILRDPHQAVCCGTRFCRPCIERIQNSKEPCPMKCMGPLEIFEDKSFKQELLKLGDVYCSNRRAGCDWKGELNQLEQHLNTELFKEKPGCEFVQVKCIHCSKEFQRRHLNEHPFDSCPQKRVCCDNASKGCQWEGMLCELEGHLNRNPVNEAQHEGCSFTMLDCPHGCGKKYMRSDLGDHEEVCSSLFDCEYCDDYRSAYDDMMHHFSKCDFHPVDCPNKCGVNLLRHEVNDHISTDCPLEVVSCEYQFVGCDVTLPRKDMPDHLGVGIVTHMSLLTSHYRNEITCKNGQIEELKRQVQENDPDVLQQQTSELIQQVTDDASDFGQWVHMFKSQVHSNRKRLSDRLYSQGFYAGLVLAITIMVVFIAFSGIAWFHNSMLSELSQKFQYIEQELFELEALKESANEEFSQKFQYIEQELFELEALKESTNEEFSQKFQYIEQELFKLEALKESAREEFSQRFQYIEQELCDKIEENTQKFVSTEEFLVSKKNSWEIHRIKEAFNNSWEDFELTEFHEYNQNETPWFSPPFYRDGYKMCLQIATNKRTGAHLSVFVHLMQGDYDDYLQWPFRGKVTIQLLSQRALVRHQQKTFHFTDKMPDNIADRVIKEEIASIGWGKKKFISHEEIKQSYLCNDRLEFQVKREMTQITAVLSNTAKKKVVELSDKVDANYNTVSKVISKLYEKLNPSFLPVTFTMEQFSDYRKNSSLWFSLPFYVPYEFGYKMCLGVYANGKGSGSESHISVDVYLMQGEFDNQLKWPFRGSITIQLLKPKKGGWWSQSHEQSVSFTDETPDRYSGRIMEGEVGKEGWGYQKFFPHQDLEPHYLEDDSLLFYISKVEI